MTDAVAWRPPTAEIEPLERAVVDAVRRAVLPIAEIGVPPPDGDGVTEIALADGRRVLLVLTARAVGTGSRRGRAVLEFHVAGQGRVGEAAFLVEGRAVLDHATRAFLDVTVDIAGVRG